MADNLFHIEIITPEKVLISDDIDSFEAPGVAGEFQILADHTPFLTALTVGPITFSKSGKKTFISISGGFCEVQPNKTVILAQTAEISSDIDTARAQAARDRAQQRIETPHDKSIDIDRAQASLARAINRLNVATMN